MKPLNARFKSILKYFLTALTFIVFIVICWAAYVYFKADETPDAGRDAFYARSETPVPDDQNLAVAISGINAPIGTDMITHGRLVINTYQIDLLSSALKNKLVNDIGIKFIGKREEFDCWLDDALEKTADNCASEKRIRELLLENKLLIGRYKKLYQIPNWQGVSNSGGQTLLDVNRLLAADIKLDIDAGNADLAYQKWKANYVFTKHVLYQENNMIEKAIFLVIQGFCLNSLDYLTLKSPEIITKNKDELFALLKPTGISNYNLHGMAKAEYHLYEDYLLSKTVAEPRIHTNYIRNRIYRMQADFLKEAEKLPFTFGESKKTLHKRYYFGRYQLWNLDLLDPINSLLSKMGTNGFLNGFNLVASMHSKSALIKLLNLKIKIQQQNIQDTNIQDFLNNAGDEYLNPFNNKPMRWDTSNRTLVCDKPNTDESHIEVRL